MLARPAGPADAAAVAWVHEVARAAYYGAPPLARTDPDREAMWRSVLADPARAAVSCVERAGAVVGYERQRAGDRLVPAAGWVLDGRSRGGPEGTASLGMPRGPGAGPVSGRWRRSAPG